MHGHIVSSLTLGRLTGPVGLGDEHQLQYGYNMPANVASRALSPIPLQQVPSEDTAF